MRPFARSASLSAISTVKTCTPVLLAISSVCGPTGRAKARTPTANRPARTKAIHLEARIGTPLRGLPAVINRKNQKYLVGCEPQWPAIGPHLGRHQTLWARSEPHQHSLARAELRNPVATQGFHVHEDVWGSFTARQEAKTPQTIEPFDLSALQPTCRRYG